MTRVQIVLHDVICRNTEDVTGPDEFYLVGVVTDGKITKTVLTTPIVINDQQQKSFENGGGVIFDSEVPSEAVVKIAILAFDEDAGKDWSKYGEIVKKINEKVSAALQLIPSPYTATASAILPSIVNAAGYIMKLDKDDLLGTLSKDIPIAVFPKGQHWQAWNFSGGSWWWSNWSYTVRYSVIVG